MIRLRNFFPVTVFGMLLGFMFSAGWLLGRSSQEDTIDSLYYRLNRQSDIIRDAVKFYTEKECSTKERDCLREKEDELLSGSLRKKNQVNYPISGDLNKQK